MMVLRDDYDFEQLVNNAERFVIDSLERQLNEAGANICTCQDCVLDMAALALNTVKPMYHVSLLGKLYAEQPTPEIAGLIDAAVKSAVNKVSTNPSHD